MVVDGIAMSLPASVVAGLSLVPFHLACMANNHAFDCGVEGLIRTKQLLERHQIRSIGAGLCREIYLTALQRVMDDELGHAPSWASKSLTD